MFCRIRFNNPLTFFNTVRYLSPYFRCRISGGIITRGPIRFCSDPETFARLLGLKSWLTSLLFINLTAAATADWSWRGNVLYFMNAMYRRERTLVMSSSLMHVKTRVRQFPYVWSSDLYFEWTCGFLKVWIFLGTFGIMLQVTSTQLDKHTADI